MPVTKGIKALVEEAYAQVETWTVEDAITRFGDDSIQLVDIRDIRELWREGTVPGAVHAPRGMLEFWVDPESPIIARSSRPTRSWCSIAPGLAQRARRQGDAGDGPDQRAIRRRLHRLEEGRRPVEEKPQPAPKKG